MFLLERSKFGGTSQFVWRGFHSTNMHCVWKQALKFIWCLFQFIRRRQKELSLRAVQTMSIGQKDLHKSLFSVWRDIFTMPRPKRYCCSDYLLFCCFCYLILVGWFISWILDCLLDWLECVAGWLFLWLVEWLINWRFFFFLCSTLGIVSCLSFIHVYKVHTCIWCDGTYSCPCLELYCTWTEYFCSCFLLLFFFTSFFFLT